MQPHKNFLPKYKKYDRQKCFVAHSLGAEWGEDLKSACAAILPKFNLEPWYAADHFDPTQPLRDKVVELIANSRYGIYDISSWQDKQGNWQLPRNVFIELGIAIALNRPTFLLCHSSNKNLPLPVCLQGVETVEFTGDITLKKELEKRLPQWLDVPPDRDWLNRFCIFGDRVCSFREQHSCSQQWGQQTLHCHIADGLDKQHPNYCQSECDEIRGIFEEIFSRYSDLEPSYLDDRSIVDGYQFLLCSHCQAVRSTPFAIYRISPTTSAETFVAIGISIALEKLFSYKIPKILLVRQKQDLPSLLEGYEVIEAACTREAKKKLKAFLPRVMQVVREKSWNPRPLPFFEQNTQVQDSTSGNVSHGMTIAKFWNLIEVSRRGSSNDKNLQVELLKQNLIQLSVEEIIEFQRIFESVLHYSRRGYLWDAAKLIMDYCSDDGFEYFRAWLIAQGKGVFQNALKNPDTLAEVINTSSKTDFEFELIMYTASGAYELKTNKAMPDTVYNNHLQESPQLVPPCELTPPYHFPQLLKLSQNRNSAKQGKVRIYELSKELNLDNRDILAVCDQLNISVKSHSSRITEVEAARIRSAAEKLSTHALGKSASSHDNSVVSEPANSRTPVKKQQILEIRKNRPLVEPPQRPTAKSYGDTPKNLPPPKTERFYIRNLRQDVTEQDIREIFSPHGSVKQVQFHFDHLGRRRDFAFVEMDFQVDINITIKALNGINLMGRKLVVRKA